MNSENTQPAKNLLETPHHKFILEATGIPEPTDLDILKGYSHDFETNPKNLTAKIWSEKTFILGCRKPDWAEDDGLRGLLCCHKVEVKWPTANSR